MGIAVLVYVITSTVFLIYMTYRWRSDNGLDMCIKMFLTALSISGTVIALRLLEVV